MSASESPSAVLEMEEDPFRAGPVRILPSVRHCDSPLAAKSASGLPLVGTTSSHSTIKMASASSSTAANTHARRPRSDSLRAHAHARNRHLTTPTADTCQAQPAHRASPKQAAATRPPVQKRKLDRHAAFSGSTAFGRGSAARDDISTPWRKRTPKQSKRRSPLSKVAYTAGDVVIEVASKADHLVIEMKLESDSAGEDSPFAGLGSRNLSSSSLLSTTSTLSPPPSPTFDSAELPIEDCIKSIAFTYAALCAAYNAKQATRKAREEARHASETRRSSPSLTRSLAEGKVKRAIWVMYSQEQETAAVGGRTASLAAWRARRQQREEFEARAAARAEAQADALVAGGRLGH